MLDYLHITLIIIAALLLFVCYYLYRAKERSNNQLLEYKDSVLEKQSTSYNIPNLKTETYERLVFKCEVPYNRKEYSNLVEEAKLMVVSNAVRDIKRFNLIKIENRFDITIEATLEVYVNKEDLS